VLDEPGQQAEAKQTLLTSRAGSPGQTGRGQADASDQSTPGAGKEELGKMLVPASQALLSATANFSSSFYVRHLHLLIFLGAV
jgi:hypothetical protein